MTVDQARLILRTRGQEHLLHFWELLESNERQELLHDIERINWPALEAAGTQETSTPTPHAILPPPVFVVDQVESAQPSFRQRGQELLTAGRVAALTVAGGQGTRLRFDGPKGMFPITPVRNKTLFEYFAESILATHRRYGGQAAWYIMTSPDNDAPTRAYFSEHAFFGLSPDAVHFFQQGTMPAVTPHGKILLAERQRIAFAPDGHGGVLAALADSGCLDDMQARHIEYVSYFQVDNPLIPPLDPTFIGLVDAERSEVGSKVVRKASNDEKVGVFGIMEGRLQVIEYSDLPDELARKKHADGTRVFDCGNIAAHVFTIDAIQRWAGGTAPLPWHRAHKAVPHADLTSGTTVEPRSPNAIKYEQFIFDTVPLARNPVLLEVDRAEEFSPVKNAEGTDSPQTSRQALTDRAKRWLAARRVSPGAREPAAVEISPLLALDADHLAAQLAGRPLAVTDPLYLE